eukprot:6204678-Pleurochrysis_carterae.AAC.2
MSNLSDEPWMSSTVRRSCMRRRERQVTRTRMGAMAVLRPKRATSDGGAVLPALLGASISCTQSTAGLSTERHARMLSLLLTFNFQTEAGSVSSSGVTRLRAVVTLLTTQRGGQKVVHRLKDKAHHRVLEEPCNNRCSPNNSIRCKCAVLKGETYSLRKLPSAGDL